VVVLDDIKGSANQVFEYQFVNQVSAFTHILPFVFDAKKQIVFKF